MISNNKWTSEHVWTIHLALEIAEFIFMDFSLNIKTKINTFIVQEKIHADNFFKLRK